MSKKAIICFVLAALMVTIFPLAASADNNTNVSVTINNNSPAVDRLGDNAALDWEQGIIEATGYGAPPAHASNPAQSKLLAQRAAKLDALRNLAECLKGVQIDEESTMENLQITSDVVKAKMSAFIKGSQVVSSQQMADGSFQVVVRVKLSGLRQIVAEGTKPAVVQQLPPPSSDYTSQTTPAAVTGVIVNARGKDLVRCCNPKIYDETGRVIYGNAFVDYSYVLKMGLVDYAASDELVAAAEGGNSRAGSNPIIVKALDIRDGNYNVIISKADADKILAANASAGFLQRCAVVFEK